MIKLYVKPDSLYCPIDEFKIRYSPSSVFKDRSKVDWMLNDFTREVLATIDESTLDEMGFVITDDGERLYPYQISGGSKALIMVANYANDMFVLGSAYMGDNCYPLLNRAVELRKRNLNLDLKFTIDSYFEVEDSLPINGVCVQNGKAFNNWGDVYDIFAELEAT